MCASSPTLDPGRMCANGPSIAPASTVESVTTVWFRTHTRSPTVELTMRVPEWISQAAPILVEPSRKTHGWITVSAPTTTSAST